jgi:hypothetical protein
MIKLPKPLVLNSKGEPIKLTPAEQYHADYVQRQVNERHANALGYEIQITTLTEIVKKVSEQKFYTIPFAKYLPVRVGQGTWMTKLTTYRSYSLGSKFEDGIIKTGGNNGKLSTSNTGVDALNINIQNWAKEIGWSIFELQEASMSGNWELVSALERSRKENWDLGLQSVAFLGADGLNGSGGQCLGLLNQGSGVTTNTDIIPQPLYAMSQTDLNQFLGTVVQAYRANCAYTAYPDRFIVPESDWNGLANQMSAQFPIKTKLEAIRDMFRVITMNPGFEVLPLAYADSGNHVGITGIDGKQVYVLYRSDETSLRMDIPLDYTATMANSLDNFSFQNAGYGQFTGVLAIRPLEMMYFTYTA